MIVDTTITVSSIAPNGAPVLRSGKIGRRAKSKSVKENQGQKKTQSGVETQGKWLKKSGKLYYGYKKHIEVK
ncbi:MAG: hypothetical protein ACMUEL_09190 [Flavobacteriales bacterium Tduv]